MSHGETQEIEAVIGATERRLYERLGRYVVAHLAGALALVLMGAGLWYGLVGRVEALESWKADRAKPIETYYSDQATLSQWRGEVNAKLDNLAESIGEIKFNLGIRSEAELNDLRRRVQEKEQNP